MPTTTLAPSALAGVATQIAAALAVGATAEAWVAPGRGAPRAAVRLFVTEDFDAWLLSWPPGTSVTPHDHGESTGAFAVVCGSVSEVRWQATGRTTRTLRAGDSITIPPGVVHDVRADGDAALSVHVYAPPLSTMAYYDDSGHVLVGEQAIA
jgi:quercetin dioxygenase-like cupin family protein